MLALTIIWAIHQLLQNQNIPPKKLNKQYFSPEFGPHPVFSTYSLLFKSFSRFSITATSTAVGYRAAAGACTAGSAPFARWPPRRRSPLSPSPPTAWEKNGGQKTHGSCEKTWTWSFKIHEFERLWQRVWLVKHQRIEQGHWNQSLYLVVFQRSRDRRHKVPT